MSCRNTLNDIVEKENGLLNAEAQAVWSEHLAACSVCRERVRTLRSQLADLEKAFIVPSPPDLTARIMRESALRSVHAHAQPRFSWVPVFSMSMAVGLLMSAGWLLVQPKWAFWEYVLAGGQSVEELTEQAVMHGLEASGGKL